MRGERKEDERYFSPKGLLGTMVFKGLRYQRYEGISGNKAQRRRRNRVPKGTLVQRRIRKIGIFDFPVESKKGIFGRMGLLTRLSPLGRRIRLGRVLATKY